MLKRVCDICGGDERVEAISLPYDQKMSPAGDMETIAETFDLCVNCQAKYYRAAIYEFLMEDRSKRDEFNGLLIEMLIKAEKERLP